MISLLDQSEAQILFTQLPPQLRLFTLSPAYSAADAQRNPALTPIWFVWREGQHFWLHGVHRAHVPDSNWMDIQSPYGYGGPLTNCEDGDFLSRAWKAWREWCRSEGILAEFLRFHPLANNSRFYSGTVRDDRQTVAISLASTPLDGYSVRVRTAVRKAIKSGVEAHWLPAKAHAAEFASFYRAGMKHIGADASYLFGDSYFSVLMDLPGVRLLVCQRDKHWLAAGLFLQDEQVMEYHLSASTPEGKVLSATNLLLHHAAETGYTAGLNWLYLGGGTDNRTNNSLLFFKKGFSKHHFAFRIGWQVFDSATYEALRNTWQTHHSLSSRILFYRF